MAQTTITRAALRRKIAKALQMKFFQVYESGYVAVTSGTGTQITCDSLFQVQNYWRGGWMLYTDYSTSIQYVRQISSFVNNASGRILFTDLTLPITPAVGDTLEIYDTYSPMLIHDAINSAIAYAGKYFPKSVYNFTTFILGRSATGEDDQIFYDLTTLAEPVWRINSIRVANPEDSYIFNAEARTGEITPGFIGTVVLPTTISFDADAFNGWTMTRVEPGAALSVTITGTIAYSPGLLGSGSVQYTSTGLSDLFAEDDFIIIYSNLLTQPPFRIQAFRLDTPEFPSQLWIEQPPSAYLDHQLILEYETIPTSLSDDDDTTTIPEQFILHHAMAYLHEAMMNDNRSDMARHQALATYHRQKADEYEVKFPQRRPASSQLIDHVDQMADDNADPLGWRA